MKNYEEMSHEWFQELGKMIEKALKPIEKETGFTFIMPSIQYEKDLKKAKLTIEMRESYSQK